MFTWIRSRLRFAGRIGWVDGRRGYPGEEQYVELVLHRPDASAGTPALNLADADAVPEAAAVHPLVTTQRS